MIGALPSINDLKLENKLAVVTAREAYNKLTELQKRLVLNIDVLEAAEAKIAELETAAAKEAADKKAAAQVETLIAALPAVDELSLEYKGAVKTARTAYNALTGDQKAFVTNLVKLTEAEAKLKELAKLLVEEKIEAIPKVENKSKGVNYDEVESAMKAVREAIVVAKEVGWTEEEIKTFEKYDKIRGTEVQVIIFKLPQPAMINYETLETYKPQVIVASEAYNNLTESEKEFVWTVSKLESDKERIIELDFLLALDNATPKTFEDLIKEYAEGIQLDLNGYDSLKDKTPVNNELAGKYYSPGTGLFGGKYEFRNDFYDAVNRQKDKEKVDKTALAAAIQEAETLLDDESASEEAIEALIAALNKADEIYLNENATQPQVDNAVTELNQAIEEFKESLVPDPDTLAISTAK